MRWKARQAHVDPGRLVFLDETWVKTNMAPLRGWGRLGERLIGKAPHGRWRTLTFIAALRVDRIDAPCVFNGPINGERFRAYVEQFLVPTLRPGDIVVLDNLGSHKGQAVRQAIRTAGAHRLFLPPYSPDLNPIEQPLPSSSTGCARPRPAPSPTYRRPSPASSTASTQANAEPSSEMPDTLLPKMIRL